MIIYIAGNGGAKGPVGREIEKHIYETSGRRLFSYWWINPDNEPNFYHNFLYWKRKIKGRSRVRLFQIKAKHFTAGAVYQDGICVDCAPIVRKRLLGKNIKALYATRFWTFKEIK